jgi:phenylpropionate dioxygenase-like ring-hydroxylating dioxygenase large terminal subunit
MVASASSVVSLRPTDIASQHELPAFDWHQHWYPVSFLEDLPAQQPMGFSIYDEPLVLYRDGDQRLVCLADRCPHRAARLSEGKLVDGRLECFYHGWQFDAEGQCRHIPQMPSSRRIPARACTRSYPVVECQGMIWVWAGVAADADPSAIPMTPALDRPDVYRVDFQMDLPYDQTYLIENIIDLAHIHIAHDGVRGGGLRELAGPLEFDLVENSNRRIASRFRTLREDAPSGEAEAKSQGETASKHAGTAELKGALVEFVAPNLVRYTSEYRDAERIAGLALYSIPLGKGRCRLLYRKYSNFTSARERWKPRWLEHWTQCLILEQDMSVVVGQYAEIERAEQALQHLWLPIKTSDRLVVEYRKWLDRVGDGLPFFRGFSRSKSGPGETHRASQAEDQQAWNRFTLHTRICASCRRAHRRIRAALTGLRIGVPILALSAIAVADEGLRILLLMLAFLGWSAIWGLEWMQRRFEA